MGNSNDCNFVALFFVLQAIVASTKLGLNIRVSFSFTVSANFLVSYTVSATAITVCVIFYHSISWLN